MASSFNTFLFGDNRIATARSGRSKHGHTFGGSHDRKGTSREDCNGILIHLLHRLDLTDPAIPFTIPGVRWLPFYYCFDFRVNDLGYRLISDEELVTFFPTDDPNVTDHEDWPDENYPLEFPKSIIEIAGYDYDPTDLEDAYRWAGIFGIGKLSNRDQVAVKKRVAEQMDGLGLGVPETDEEFDEALSTPFTQGKPDTPCINPKCIDHKKRGKLIPMALMPAEPVKGIHTFGEGGGGGAVDFPDVSQVLRDSGEQSVRLSEATAIKFENSMLGERHQRTDSSYFSLVYLNRLDPVSLRFRH